MADITYDPMVAGFLYLSLITDTYSHKIMGYCVGDSLGAIHTTKALQMALEHYPNHCGLIHHSGRGVQYCSEGYVKLLEEYHVKLSMTENGDPLENAVAERINGILKTEYLKHYTIQNQSQATRLLESIVYRYNHERPHQIIKMLTTETVHK